MEEPTFDHESNLRDGGEPKIVKTSADTSPDGFRQELEEQAGPVPEGIPATDDKLDLDELEEELEEAEAEEAQAKADEPSTSENPDTNYLNN